MLKYLTTLELKLKDTGSNIHLGALSCPLYRALRECKDFKYLTIDS